jgi:hypothetical protein
MKISLSKLRINQYKCFGLIDEHGEEVWNKLTDADLIEIDLYKIRSPKHHRLFFAMLNFAYKNLNEDFKFKYPVIDDFREDCLILSGYCKKVWCEKEKRYKVKAKSINWRTLDEIGFSEVHSKVVDVLLEYYCEGEEMQMEILNFI